MEPLGNASDPRFFMICQSSQPPSWEGFASQNRGNFVLNTSMTYASRMRELSQNIVRHNGPKAFNTFSSK